MATRSTKCHDNGAMLAITPPKVINKHVCVLLIEKEIKGIVKKKTTTTKREETKEKNRGKGVF